MELKLNVIGTIFSKAVYAAITEAKEQGIDFGEAELDEDDQAKETITTPTELSLYEEDDDQLTFQLKTKIKDTEYYFFINKEEAKVLCSHIKAFYSRKSIVE